MRLQRLPLVDNQHPVTHCQKCGVAGDTYHGPVFIDLDTQSCYHAACVPEQGDPVDLPGYEKPDHWMETNRNGFSGDDHF